MGAINRHPGHARISCREWTQTLLLGLILSISTMSATAFADESAGKSADAGQLANEHPAGPAGYATPDNSPPRPADPNAIDAETAWHLPPQGVGLRGPGGAPIFDNGMPVDDFGDPATHVSLAVDGAATIWRYSAAAADDFVLPPSQVSPGSNYNIHTVRVVMSFFNSGAASATPLTTWLQGVYVTIYHNSPLNQPSGAPAVVGGNVVFTGTLAATALIPVTALANEVVIQSGCRSRYQIDIPVNFPVAAETRYWLSVMPRFAAPPQSGWAISAEGTAGSFPAHRGANFGPPFWTVIEGNAGAFECSAGEPAGTLQELSFQLYATELQSDMGACCNMMTGVCADVDRVANPSACMGVDEVYHGGQLCSLLSPACNEGACCYTDGFNVDQCIETTAANCQASFSGHTFTLGESCSGRDCTRPPVNNNCAQSTPISGNNISQNFNSVNASTEPSSPATPNCGQIVRDVWYDYTVSCTGTVVVTTIGSSFDTVLAVYSNGTATCPACPTTLADYIGCNDDNPIDPGTTYSILALPGMQVGQCLKIRVGGKPGAMPEGGPGILRIFCIPAGQGACCKVDGTCSLELESNCPAPNRWYDGEPCGSPATCVPNDACVSPIPLPSQKAILRPFNTTRATTGPVPTNCGTIQQDIWFSYVAPCTGDVEINTDGSLYDTFLAVYDTTGGLACPDPTLCNDLPARELDCNDDQPSDPLARIRLTGITAGDCLLIRVGGHDNGFALSGGEGLLNVFCVAPNEGACCYANGDPCAIVEDIDCTTPNVFHAGLICRPDLCPEMPENDDCANATLLPSMSPLVEVFDTTTATSPSDAPVTNCGAVLADVWYQYVVPCDGTLVITTASSSYDTALAVYGESAVCPAACPAPAPTGNFTELACSDDINGADLTSRVLLFVSTGDCLLIRVGGHETSPGVGAAGMGQLNIECTAGVLGACCHADHMCESPVVEMDACMNPGDQFFPGEFCDDTNCPPLLPNDECDGAILLMDGDTAFDTTLATTGGPAITPTPTCPAPEMDLWYSYEASCTGVATVSLCNGTTFDSVLAIYAGCSCPPVDAPIACDDNGCGPTGASEVLFPVTMGNCYLIRVGGVGGGSGIGTISISCDDTMNPCCKGDADGSGALDVNDVQPFADVILNPPSDPMDPVFCRADINDDMVLDGRDIAPFVEALLTGATCDPLSQGACCFNDGSCTIASQDVCVNGGGSYHGNNTDCSPNPCPQPPTPPVNDNCSGAIELLCGVPVTVNNELGTTLPGDPEFSCRFGGPDPGVGNVWFKFTATDTDALVSTCDSTGPVTDTIIAIYDDVCPADASNEIACSEDAGGTCGRLSQACVDGLTIGNTYLVQVASYDLASRGPITVELSCPCPIGACCLPDGTCEERRSDTCLADSGHFQGEGVPCTPLPCVQPPSTLTCCVGDFTGDGTLDDADGALFVDALLNPPMFGTQAFCRADANRDDAVDGRDVDAFVAAVLSGAGCPAPANDACDAPSTIACGERVLVENNYATTAMTDPGYTCRAGGAGKGVGTLWFAFEATAATAHVSTCDSLPPAVDTIIAVYSAECPSVASQLACSEDAGSGCGRLSDLCVGGLVPGTIYYVQVSSFDANSLGFISLLVECPCP